MDCDLFKVLLPGFKPVKDRSKLLRLLCGSPGVGTPSHATVGFMRKGRGPLILGLVLAFAERGRVYEVLLGVPKAGDASSTEARREE